MSEGHPKPRESIKKEDVINGVECSDVKETEVGFLLVADGKNRFIVPKTSMVSMEWHSVSARSVEVEE